MKVVKPSKRTHIDVMFWQGEGIPPAFGSLDICIPASFRRDLKRFLRNLRPKDTPVFENARLSFDLKLDDE